MGVPFTYNNTQISFLVKWAWCDQTAGRGFTSVLSLITVTYMFSGWCCLAKRHSTTSLTKRLRSFTLKCFTEATDNVKLRWQTFGVFFTRMCPKTCDAIGMDGRIDSLLIFMFVFHVWICKYSVCLADTVNVGY